MFVALVYTENFCCLSSAWHAHQRKLLLSPFDYCYSFGLGKASTEIKADCQQWLRAGDRSLWALMVQWQIQSMGQACSVTLCSRMELFGAEVLGGGSCRRVIHSCCCCVTTNFSNIHQLIQSFWQNWSYSSRWVRSGMVQGLEGEQIPPNIQCVFLLLLPQQRDFANSLTFYRSCRWKINTWSTCGVSWKLPSMKQGGCL